MRSPIVGAEVHADSLREPSMLIGLLIDVTAADRIEAGASTWARPSVAAPAITHNTSEATRTQRSMGSLIGNRLRELPRQRDAEPFGPGPQCREDGLMKLNTFANLTAPARERAFSRKPHGRVAGRDWRVMTQLNQVLHLASERVAPTERIWIDQLHEHRRHPRRGLLGSPVARKPRCQRLNDERERKSFVAELESAKWQHCARSLSRQYGRIVACATIRVD